ncbi:SDR family oxidoreductase [Sphingomonas sp. IW22]|uniref:SDR family oxidoreductase n=1 Tax=Sphingomonas sp. IW22 TaxID=3242489 RepID=UPI003522A5D1
MPFSLKPLSNQVIVITGATSGHGLCTAQMAAAAGAKVMLAARDESALRRVRDEIRASGGTAEYVVTDTGIEAEVNHLAAETIARFGGFDTWVNNAGIGVYARILELAIDDHRKVFETNYWGMVHGSMAAVRYLKDQDGGAVINVGSINSDMGGPLLAAYNASKHAVKGFTNSLRIEMMMSRYPVSVTLIKPSAIGTPFTEHGRNTTGYQARLPRPIYAPDVVAKAILDAAQHRRRAVTVGGGGKFQVLGAVMLPSLFDRIAVKMADALIDRNTPVEAVEGNLYQPQGNDGQTEGRQRGRRFSSFTAARRHGWMTAGAIAALGTAGALILRRRSNTRSLSAPRRSGAA